MSQAFRLVLDWVVARSTEVGARTLVHGVSAGRESHGQYMSNGQNEDVEKWIYSDTGKMVQNKVFEQTIDVLEERRLSIREVLGL